VEHGMKTLTLLFVMLCALAAWSMAAGNPTAINGAIGAGACALVFIVLALIEWSTA
jgi:hypothetical protein